MNNNIIQRR